MGKMPKLSLEPPHSTYLTQNRHTHTLTLHKHVRRHSTTRADTMKDNVPSSFINGVLYGSNLGQYANSNGQLLT